MLLEEIEAGACSGTDWQPFSLRLLQILAQKCAQSGLPLSHMQVERIEALVELDPVRAASLLNDLRNRIGDEEQYMPAAQNLGPTRMALLQLLLKEIETTVQERHPSGAGLTSWNRHCARFLEVLRQRCVAMGLEFSLAQIDRVRNSANLHPEKLTDLLRDLRNRLADEQEHTTLIRMPDRVARVAPGSGR